MLSFTTPTVYEASKCFFTYGTMSYPDAKQPPSKGKPWNALLNQNFVHKVSDIHLHIQLTPSSYISAFSLLELFN